jgi:hypothetical protein
MCTDISCFVTKRSIEAPVVLRSTLLWLCPARYDPAFAFQTSQAYPFRQSEGPSSQCLNLIRSSLFKLKFAFLFGVRISALDQLLSLSSSRHLLQCLLPTVPTPSTSSLPPLPYSPPLNHVKSSCFISRTLYQIQS